MRFVILALVSLTFAVTTAQSAINPDAVAVIIGNKNYRGIPTVEFADRDAEAMRRYVIDILGFSEQNVIFEADVTYGRMIALFDTAPAHPGQLSRWLIPHAAKRDVFVYYSGHGFPGMDNHKAYLLPVDADPLGAEATGYSLELLQSNLLALGARSVTLVLDACFSGESGAGKLVSDRSILVRAADPVLPAPNITIFAASGPRETANWDRRDQHGLFTEYFLRAVYGAADDPAYGGKHTGRVSATMVKDYLDSEMSKVAARQMGSTQFASLSGITDVMLAVLTPGEFPMRPDVVPSPMPKPPVGTPVVLSPRAPSAAGVTDCDRLAQPPRKEFGRLSALVDGVEFRKMDGTAALAACDAALRRFPAEARFHVWRGLALDRLGRAKDAVVEYRVGADQGNAFGQTNLSDCYAEGECGLTKDDREATRLYRLAADQGKPDAQTSLGWSYQTGGGGLTKDEPEAARLYRLAAEQGDATGQDHLASFYANGQGGLTKDDREAARLYRLAADQGDANAQTNLGFFYEEGRGGLAKGDREAARLYRLAADQGNPDGQANLGIYYANGRGGLIKNEREAARLYRLAADQGNARAQTNLSIYYENGRGGLIKDEREAARLYRLAANQGNARAQTHLGIYYESGRGGLTKDEREAASLYRLAADQGDTAGQTDLGRFFANGQGGLTQDDREAARLFRLAADQGQARAQSWLGLFYQEGRGGLANDIGEAIRWYQIAARKGDTFAQQQLKDLGKDW